MRRRTGRRGTRPEVPCRRRNRLPPTESSRQMRRERRRCLSVPPTASPRSACPQDPGLLSFELAEDVVRSSAAPTTAPVIAVSNRAIGRFSRAGPSSSLAWMRRLTSRPAPTSLLLPKDRATRCSSSTTHALSAHEPRCSVGHRRSRPRTPSHDEDRPTVQRDEGLSSPASVSLHPQGDPYEARPDPGCRHRARRRGAGCRLTDEPASGRS